MDFKLFKEGACDWIYEETIATSSVTIVGQVHLVVKELSVVFGVESNRFELYLSLTLFKHCNVPLNIFQSLKHFVLAFLFNISFIFQLSLLTNTCLDC